MYKSISTFLGIGQQAVQKADTEIAHRMAIENPELYMDSEIAKQQAKVADFRQRYLAAQTAKNEDVGRNAAAQKKYDDQLARMNGLREKAEAAQSANDGESRNKAIALAHGVKPLLDAAEKALKTELANDERIDSMLATVKEAYELAQSELTRKKEQKQDFVAAMTEAKAREDKMAMEKEIRGLSEDDGGLNPDDIMAQVQAKADERLRELELMDDEAVDPSGMADVDAFLADDGKDEPSDPMDVFK